MSSTLITDYLAYGTHADRPATPNVPAGATSLYFETDTQLAYAWSGSAWVLVNPVSSTGPSLVQGAAMAGGAEGSVTLPNAPTAGNLLIAIICDYGSGTCNNGWTSVTASAGGADGFGYGFKIAGGSESATQTPTTNTNSGCVAVWELTNATPSSIFARTIGLSSTAMSQAYTTQAASQLCLGVCDRYTAGAPAPSSVSGIDNYATVSGANRTLTYFNTAPNTKGANTVTLNYATAYAGVIGVVLVG